jgi:predicted nucleotidyltransferase
MRDKDSVTGLNQLLKILAENNIDFIVIGGFAGVLYGSTLVTRDLDICSALAPADIERLRKVLSPYHPTHRMTPQKLSFMTEPRSIESIDNLYLETDYGVLDILSTVKGLPAFDILKKRATKFELFGNKVNVLSISDLIEAKKQMGRPKDKMSADELEQIRMTFIPKNE